MKKEIQKFDAIVVGSGMSGGWAAKELTEKGLKTLVLERGRKVEHIIDYPTTNMAPWEFKYRKQPDQKTREEYHVQNSVYAFNEATKHFFVNDKKHPYSTPDDKPFMWRRGYQSGGKSLLWARLSFRLSPIDFEANAKDGYGVEWPLTYDEIAPWYDYVEKYIGVTGRKEGLKQLPDGQFMPPMDLNCVEEHMRDSIKKNFNRTLTIARAAHLTKPLNGRGPCQYRNMCETGCPYGAYFSSVSVTLPAAQATGNMTFRPHAIVHSVIYDEEKRKATGVRIIDAQSKETKEYFADLVFLCAGTLPSTQIMLNSKTDSFPDGLANSSGQLGHNIMDHFFYGMYAEVDGFEDGYYNGHRPIGFYIPRFHNIDDKHPDFLRGYAFQGAGIRQGWSRGIQEEGFGADFKNQMSKPGPWIMYLSGYGEILPYYDNKVELHPEMKDEWGIPLLDISCELKENEKAMQQSMYEEGQAMMEKAGYKNFTKAPATWKFGDGIHEMGAARMGKNPETSVLNKWNQCHDVPNLFITDGSFMASSACQNPSLTYMAFTARAVDHAVKEYNKKNLT